MALPPRFDAMDLFVRECGIPLTRIGLATEGSGVASGAGAYIVEGT